jgi:DNA-binding CsgD family transcriptional regulator
MQPREDTIESRAKIDKQPLQRLLALAEGPGTAEEKLDQIRGELRSMLFENASGPSFVVNARQLKTLELLAQGLSNRSIARRLDLAEETVKCHVRSLLDRLNVPNRTSLALWAIREGVVPMHGRPQPNARENWARQPGLDVKSEAARNYV